MSEVDGPWVKEDNEDIKGQKDKSIEIVMEVKLNPGLPYSFHAAFKDGAFNGIGITGDNSKKPEDNGNNYHRKGEKNDDYLEQSN